MHTFFRVGDDLLQFLLTECSLFISIKRNFVQISGNLSTIIYAQSTDINSITVHYLFCTNWCFCCSGLPIYNVLGRNYTPLRVATRKRRHNPSPTNEHPTTAEQRAIGPPHLKQPKPAPLPVKTSALMHEEHTQQATVNEDGIQHLPQEQAHGAVTKETVAELLTTHACQNGSQVTFELCKQRKHRRRWRGQWTGRTGRQIRLVRQQARRRKRLQRRVSKGKCCRTRSVRTFCYMI